MRRSGWALGGAAAGKAVAELIGRSAARDNQRFIDEARTHANEPKPSLAPLRDSMTSTQE